MIQSVFNYVKEHIKDDYTIDNLREHLRMCGALKTFNEVYQDYGEDADKIICYLIYAYSFDSSFVTAGEDWLSVQKGIMELLGMDCDKFAEILSFKRQSIKDSILYLSHEVKDLRYHEIIILKESCKILDTIATTYPDSKSKGGAKNISDSVKASHENKQKILKLENEIRSQTKSSGRLKQAQELNLDRMSMEYLLKNLKS